MTSRARPGPAHGRVCRIQMESTHAQGFSGLLLAGQRRPGIRSTMPWFAVAREYRTWLGQGQWLSPTLMFSMGYVSDSQRYPTHGGHSRNRWIGACFPASSGVPRTYLRVNAVLSGMTTLRKLSLSVISTVQIPVGSPGSPMKLITGAAWYR